MNGEEQPEVPVVVEEAPPAAEPEFEFVTLPPEVSFALRDVQPPAECYISPDDSLLVEAWNVLAGVVLVINVRLLKPDGTLIQNTWTFTPTAAGALNTWQQDLAEGFLTTLSVDSVQAMAGACYVRVRLLRGAAPGVYLVSQTMAAGYVVRGSALSWPYPRFVGPCEGPGRLRVIVGTDPAPGVEILEVVPAGVRWRVRTIFLVFTTTNAGVNRVVLFVVDDGATVILNIEPAVAHLLNQTWGYNYAPGLQARTVVLYNQQHQPFPIEFGLLPGYRIRTATINMLVGDNFGAPVMLVEEWVEP